DSSSSSTKPKKAPQRLGSAKAEGGWVQKPEKASAAATAAMTPSPAMMERTRIPGGAEPATLMFEKNEQQSTPESRAAEVERERARREKLREQRKKAAAGELQIDNKKLLIGAGVVAAAALLMFIVVAAVSSEDEDQKAFTRGLEQIDASLGKDKLPDDLIDDLDVDDDLPEPVAPKVERGAKSARLAITCDGTIITVDGVEVGFCPDKMVAVTPGLHHVQVQTTRGPRSAKVVVGANRVESVRLVRPKARRRNPTRTVPAPIR
ncbi:MAG: hypothetical protein AAFY60_05895, partial [Myxococcota bacterium]